jgi:tetratricopeptide (TPR) repeat protein
MTGRQDLFDESMRLGHSAAWDLKWNRAIEYYKKALAEFPEDANALSSLGLALIETGSFNDALATYHKASKANPDDPIPIERCAEIFERLGQIEEAVTQRNNAAERYLRRKDAQKAIENWGHIARLEPANLPTRSRLALTYERTGRVREAVHEYLAVASILQSGDKKERAIEALQRALRVSPGDPEASKALKKVQQDKKLPPPSQPRGATAPLRMAKVQEFLKADSVDETKKDGDLPDPEVAAQRQALTILAGLLFDEPKDEDGDKAEGPDADSISKGKKRGRRKTIGKTQMYHYLGQAIDLQTRGHNDKAVKEYERALKAGLEHPAAYYNIGLLYKDLEDYKVAHKHLTASLGHPELDLGANLALGRISRSQEDLPEAARYLLQALRLADGLSVDESQSASLNQFYDTIQASQAEGNDEELAQIVESTLDFLTGPDWLHKLRQARLQLESQAQATETVVPIAEMLAVGGTDQVLQSLTNIDDFISRELYLVALEEAMLAIDRAPTYLALHKRMAEILITMGNTKAGLEKMSLIAETHRVRGEISQAVDVYRKIISASPINIQARNRLIELLAQQDLNNEALQQYIDLADIYRDMAEIDFAREALATGLLIAQEASVDRKWTLQILNEMGDIDLSRLDVRRALRVYSQIRTIDPRDESARRHLIDLHLRLGQEDQAAQELDSFLEFLVQDNRGAEALIILEELARENPGKKTLHPRLAEAYRAAGRMADAIAQYDALGEIQLDAGDIKDAIETIKTIIQLNPPDLEGYEELLRNLTAE